jgi:hypothetical protein
MNSMLALHIMIALRLSIQRKSTMKRAVLYLRVSTIDQTTTNQERELREVAERAGWQVAKVYRDHGISGAKGRDKRPAFDASEGAPDGDGAPSGYAPFRLVRT